MARPGRSRLAIALGSLLLLAGILLIIQGGALLSVDQPVRARSPDVDDTQPVRPFAPVAGAQRLEPARKVAQDLIAPP
ncbi:thermonuclease family protein, partial [Mesorhizobium sp. M7A.F.Ca.CA.002.04.1.1]